MSATVGRSGPTPQSDQDDDGRMFELANQHVFRTKLYCPPVWQPNESGIYVAI